MATHRINRFARRVKRAMQKTSVKVYLADGKRWFPPEDYYGPEAVVDLTELETLPENQVDSYAWAMKQELA